MMAEPDLNDIKLTIRSIITSFPGVPITSQVLDDFKKLEGYPLPYKKLGFNTVFELFKSMNDVVKMPRYPTMDSPIKLITDQKSQHIRELVASQKNKKSRKHFFKRDSNFVGSRNTSDSRHFNSYPSNFHARGYDHVRKNTVSYTKPKGKVTENLQSFIEDLCNSSESRSISTNKLKACLIKHPDYAKLETTNLEVAINMLKYFIYIDKGGVHLKESYRQIFSPKNFKTTSNPISEDYAQCTIDDEEISNFDVDCYDYGLTQDFSSSFENLNESNFNNLQLKNRDTIINQEKKDDTLKTTRVLKDKPLNNNIKLKIESKANDESKKLITNLSDKREFDYKSAIVNIIALSQTPVTVKEVLKSFKIKYGYDFPNEKLSCRSCMDFFRLHSDVFKLNNPFSTNSLIMVDKITPKPTVSYRKYFIKASILYNQAYLDTWNVDYISEDLDSCSISEISDHQKSTENIENIHCTESVNVYSKICDSEMVKESMKEKMRTLLTKYEKGILCNEFMDIYAKEYNSQFTFYEYGFKSMKDMAYKLPSVFYVKVSGDDCILFNACRQNELNNENNLSDPSQYYKNIPKTILHNLSSFFENHDGIQFDDLKTLYCSQFGKCYEPLKYGYSSEMHMFESLNKMVEIRHNRIFTKDPFAYTYFLEDKNTINNDKKDISVYMDNNFLMNYSGKDICNGKFVFSPFLLGNQKSIKVFVAEIYNPSSFYVHMASQVETLEIFMKNLQEVYNKFGDQLKVLPELIIPGLVCTSCFEYGELWHRALILKVIDENYVLVLYVDYGSIETVLKSNIRFLKSEFGNLPIQSIHCSLYENGHQPEIYSRELNEYFAKLVEDKILEANIRCFTKSADRKMVVTLYSKYKNNQININKLCSKEIKKRTVKYQESIRRTATTVLQDDDKRED